MQSSDRKKNLRRRRAKSHGQVEILSTTLGRAVSVIGVISVIAIGVYLYNDMQQDAMVSEIEAIIAAVDAQYLPTGTFEGLSTQTMASTGVFPQSYLGIQDGGWPGLITPWHSMLWVDFAYNSITNIQYGAWNLTMPSVPVAECNILATMKFHSELGMSMNDDARNPADNLSSNYQPLSPSDAALACSNNGASSGSVPMKLTFG